MFTSMHVRQGEAVLGNPNPSVPLFQVLGMFRGWEEARAWLLGPVNPAACAGGQEVDASCCWLLLRPKRICLLLDHQGEARRSLASLRCMKAAR